MKIYDYFHIEDEVLNIYKNISWGQLLDSELYTLHTPSQYDNLMGLSYKYYQTVNDWWIIYYFNKMTDQTFGILSTSTINATIEYYINLMKTYDELSVKDKLLIKECIVNFYIHQGDTYEVAIQKATANLGNLTYRTDPVMISDLKDYLFMHIMSDTTYSDPIKIPQLQVVYRMKSIMNQYEIDWKIT